MAKKSTGKVVWDDAQKKIVPQGEEVVTFKPKQPPMKYDKINFDVALASYNIEEDKFKGFVDHCVAMSQQPAEEDAAYQALSTQISSCDPVTEHVKSIGSQNLADPSAVECGVQMIAVLDAAKALLEKNRMYWDVIRKKKEMDASRTPTGAGNLPVNTNFDNEGPTPGYQSPEFMKPGDTKDIKTGEITPADPNFKVTPEMKDKFDRRGPLFKNAYAEGFAVAKDLVVKYLLTNPGSLKEIGNFVWNLEQPPIPE